MDIREIRVSISIEAYILVVMTLVWYCALNCKSLVSYKGRDRLHIFFTQRYYWWPAQKFIYSAIFMLEHLCGFLLLLTVPPKPVLQLNLPPIVMLKVLRLQRTAYPRFSRLIHHLLPVYQNLILSLRFSNHKQERMRLSQIKTMRNLKQIYPIHRAQIIMWILKFLGHHNLWYSCFVFSLWSFTSVMHYMCLFCWDP